MTTTRLAKTLLVIIAEAAIGKAPVRDARRLGAHGWTVGEVRGGGVSGVREGSWEADRTVELKLIGDAIADHVRVLRPQRY